LLGDAKGKIGGRIARRVAGKVTGRLQPSSKRAPLAWAAESCL